MLHDFFVWRKFCNGGPLKAMSAQKRAKLWKLLKQWKETQELQKKYNCIRFHLIFACVSSKKRYLRLPSLNTHFSLQKCMSTTLFTVVPQRWFSKYKMKTIHFGVYGFSGENRPAFSGNTQRVAIAASQFFYCVFRRQTSLGWGKSIWWYSGATICFNGTLMY